MDYKIMTLFYCEYAHMQCARIYEKNHAFLTFTDSITHFFWSTATAGGARRGGKLL